MGNMTDTHETNSHRDKQEALWRGEQDTKKAANMHHPWGGPAGAARMGRGGMSSG